MNFKKEEKYKEKITELQRSIRFLSNNISHAAEKLNTIHRKNNQVAYVILLLKDTLNDKRYILK